MKKPDDEPWITVPAGTASATCSAVRCRARIFWVQRRGRPHPVDCAIEGGAEPSIDPSAPPDLFAPPAPPGTHNGRGVSHFATCPEAHRFRPGVGE